MSKSSQTILVLGGGTGGIVTANRLRRRLPARHRVVLVDRNADHLFQPSLLWLLDGSRRPEQITRPLHKMLRKGIEVVVDEIQTIDPANRTVQVDGESLAGDWVVVSLGAELAPETIPGMAEAGFNLYSAKGAKGSRGALETFRSGRIVVLTAAPAYKCPAAPYEASMLLASELKRHRSADIEIALYTAEPRPMGVAGAHVSEAVEQMVKSHGIERFPGHQISEVNPQTTTLIFSNGVTSSYDLLAYVPPHRPPSVVRDSALAGDGGWIDVDRHTLATDFERIYAIGDVTRIPLQVSKPLPMAGTFAHTQAEVVADNIASAILDKNTASRFDGHGSCFVEVGDGRAGFGAGNFFAEPTPRIKLRNPSRRWHWGKVVLEKTWLSHLYYRTRS